MVGLRRPVFVAAWRSPCNGNKPDASAAMTASNVKKALAELADPEKAAFYPRFFRAGKGEYGEGDQFIGVVVPNQRKVARKHRTLPLGEVDLLLRSPIHEHRLTALLILVEQFQRGDAAKRSEVANFYLARLDRVNNWDLVDLSAPKILGPYLQNRSRELLYELAASGQLWRQRIAVLANYPYIKRGDFDDILRLADQLLEHRHDLIHKAVGWMLREVGKQDMPVLEAFLHSRYTRMPRTTLRYAIERMEPARRKAYLKGTV